MSPPSDPAAQVLALALSRPSTLGAGRLLCIDGPAGSGKTTLAAAIADLTPATVVHLDDLYEGWDGLPGVGARLRPLLAPLAEEIPGEYRRWDWAAGAYAETVTVAPTPLLVLEGVGSWSREIAPWVTALVWLEAPESVRKERALARDGDVFAPHWGQWARDEATLYAREHTRDHAALIVDSDRCPLG